MKLSDELRRHWGHLQHGAGAIPLGLPAHPVIRAADELDRLDAEINRLTAALPKSADGVTIVPGMEVWLDRYSEIVPARISSVGVYSGLTGVIESDWGATGLDYRSIYSTRTAAEEAAK